MRSEYFHVKNEIASCQVVRFRCSKSQDVRSDEFALIKKCDELALFEAGKQEFTRGDEALGRVQDYTVECRARCSGLGLRSETQESEDKHWFQVLSIIVCACVMLCSVYRRHRHCSITTYSHR